MEIGVNNIDERKMSEETIKGSELNLKTIFDNISESVLLADKDGIIISFNNKTKENVFRNINKELKIGKSVFYYIEKSRKPFFKETVNKALNGEAVQYDYEYKRNSDEKVCFQFSIDPVYDKSIITGICITGRDITKSKEAEKKLKKSEQDYRYLFENNPLPLWIYDLDTYKFLEVNKAAIWLYGYTREEFLSMNALNIIAENYFEKFENHLRNIKVHNAFYRGFWEHIKKNGESIYVEISAMPLAYNNKNARLVLLNDITQKKIADERIIQSETHLAEAQRLAKMGSWYFDFKADRLTWSDELYNVFGTDKQTFIETYDSFIHLVDAEDRESVLQTSRHTQETGEPFTLEYHITTPKGEKRVIQEIGYGKTGTNGKVTHLFGTAQDITERKRVEEELKKKNTFIQTVLDNLPIGIALNEIDKGRAFYVNKKFEEIYGWSKDEMKDIPDFFEKVYPDKKYREELKLKIIADIQSGDISRMHWEDCIVTHKDGSTHIINAVNIPLAEQNTMVSTVIDITGRKRAEDELRESEERFRYSFDYAAAGMCIVGIDYKFQRINITFKEMIGYDEDEIKNFTFSDITHPDDLSIGLSQIKKMLDGEIDNASVEKRYIGKDKRIIWAYISISLIRNINHQPQFFITQLIDITERKQAEQELIIANKELKKAGEELTEKEFFLRESQRVGNIGSYKVNFVTEYWQSSETFDSIFGIDKNYDRSIAGWLEIVHPDDRQNMDEYLRLEVIGKRKSFNKEYRIVRNNDKQTRWVYGRGDVKFDDSSNVTNMIGTIQDITERKNEEELLRQSEINLRAIFENTDTGFYLLDKEANIIAFNKIVNEFANLSFGFELQEKQNLIKLFAPERQQQFADIFSETIKGTNITYEINYPQIDGTIIWYSVSGNQVHNSNGKVVGVCVAVNNITERKLAELQLQENEKAITNLNENLKKRAEELAVSNEELERYAYVTSHDLQEPLRMVTSFLQLLQKKYDQQLDDTAQKYINFAVDGAARMKTLILDLLEFSRISSVKQRHTIINLNDVVAKTRLALKAPIDESQATINVPFLPQVCGNESQLLQLFQNLIGNAIKYKSNLKPVIEIGYTETPGEWQFYVQDNGIGIDQKFFEKIFIIFQRLHNKKEYEGTGIGLAICKKIVELHGGKIWVESSKEHGSKFYFTILKLQMFDGNDAEMLCPDITGNPLKNTI
jgi:PAS domain S-box-containing protein